MISPKYDLGAYTSGFAARLYPYASVSRCALYRPTYTVYSLRPPASSPVTPRDRRYATSTYVDMQQQRWLGSEGEFAGRMPADRTTAGPSSLAIGRTVAAMQQEPRPPLKVTP